MGARERERKDAGVMNGQENVKQLPLVADCGSK